MFGGGGSLRAPAFRAILTHLSTVILCAHNSRIMVTHESPLRRSDIGDECLYYVASTNLRNDRVCYQILCLQLSPLFSDMRAMGRSARLKPRPRRLRAKLVRFEY